jgi:hypothetical protein
MRERANRIGLNFVRRSARSADGAVARPAADPPLLNDEEIAAIDDLVFVCRHLRDRRPLLADLHILLLRHVSRLPERKSSARFAPGEGRRIADRSGSQ